MSQTTSVGIDDLLVARVCQQDQMAFDHLYMQYRGRVYRAVNTIVRNHFIAEELVQEVFLKSWSRAGDFEQGASRSISAWLVAIGRNRAIDYIRSVEHRLDKNCRELLPLDCPLGGCCEEQRIMTACQTFRLTSALEKLTPVQRQMVNAVYFEGLSHSETALREQKPLGTVKTWVRQAIAALRAEMASAA